jgi:hypothetical protein
MKVTFKVNLGRDDAKRFGLENEKCLKGATVDVTPEQHKAITKKYPAIFGDPSAPAIRAVPEKLPAKA